MPAIIQPTLRALKGNKLQGDASKHTSSYIKRVFIPYNPATAPHGLILAETIDPWSKSGKYALGWVYFSLALLVLALLVRLFHLWCDKIRIALHKDEFLDQLRLNQSFSPSRSISQGQTPIETPRTGSERSTTFIFPRHEIQEHITANKKESRVASIVPVNNVIALFRYAFYQPTPLVKLRKGWRPVLFPPMSAIAISFAALVFTVLYCFVPQPLYWQSIRFGSPPLAIRAGMLAVALMPWLIALSAKANLITFLTGIGHERLNVLHRWGGWLCLLLSLIHTIPFYISPIWDHGGYLTFRSYFGTGIYIYGTGVAALVPLCFLCLHSLPFLRNWMYELFLILHVPVAILFLAMMFWHCNNYLTSWNYLFATTGIWLFSYIMRVFYLNWSNPFRLSWLIGDDASVHILPENALKVTIPTQKRWRPGQFIYLRMPGVSIFENHPFTITSLCSEEFPSEYGDKYRDMVLVFRPYGGFTKRLLKKALDKGPWHCHRAFLDGPYGGMKRSLSAFDTIVLIAGGSGITALTSHLLDLIKRMRDGKAVTKRIHVVWALKRPETMEWFKEELRICREFAPLDSITFQFYITAAKRQVNTGQLVSASTPSRPIDETFRGKVNHTFNGLIGNKRTSVYSEPSTGRLSAMVNDEAKGDPEKESELRREIEDRIVALPQAHVLPPRNIPNFSHVTPHTLIPMQQKRHPKMALSLDIAAATRVKPGSVQTIEIPPPPSKSLRTSTAVPPPRSLGIPEPLPQSKEVDENNPGFDFGFPTTPTEFQKNLMRFAFLPAAVRKRGGWSTEYGRPDIPYMLRQFSKEFGKRTCVFVCGPPGMRIDASRAVARLQTKVMSNSMIDEIYLHTENYAL